MRTSTARAVRLHAALALFTAVTTAVVVGCGTAEVDDDGGGARVRNAVQAPEAKERAREVAEAWEGSEAAEVWAKGYYPMGDTVQLPDNAFLDGNDKEAYLAGRFVLRGELPESPKGEGKVEWESGGSLTLPLTGARKSYESMASGGDGEPHLTVTGAKLGEMSLVTSRGPATVPAWLFTLEGYDTPLKRVALSSSQLPEPPIRPAADTPSAELWELAGLVKAAEDGRSLTVMAHHGACDDGPAVHVLETAGSVVLSGSIVGTKDGACTSQLLSKQVTVKLERPVGERILLDAFTGEPLPYVKRYMSWS